LAAVELPSLKDWRRDRPSVVNLSVVKNVKAYGLAKATGDPLMDSFFGRFFG